MFRSIRFWAAVLLVALLLCCIAWKGFPAVQHNYGEQRVTAGAAAPQEDSFTGLEPSTVTVPDSTQENTPSTQTLLPENKEKDDASLPLISEEKVSEIIGRMKAVSEYSEDMIGWIYMADSDIDYPVVQGRDDQYYLHHAPDGSQTINGSIFLSALCAPDLSHKQNILYGHDMRTEMFGYLKHLRNHEAFDKHRYGWFFTKEKLYRIEFYALALVNAYDAIYDIPADHGEWQKTLKSHCLYDRQPENSGNCSVIALSTCAYDFENARLLFVGQLIADREIKLND